MQSVLLRAFCVVVMASGWYYLFYSKAAERLGVIEARPRNLRRARLRRVGGFVIMLLGAALYVGMFGVGWDPPTRSFVVVWLLVLGLLATAVGLALVDVVLTGKIRRERQGFPADGTARKKDGEE